MSADDFESRLNSAIARGKRRADHGEAQKRAQQLTVDELKTMHTALRLRLSDRIEKAVHGVADNFPGFREESIYGEAGWGHACYRDDLSLVGGKRNNLYSRLEMVIRPFNDSHVVDLKGKSTVANREFFNRSFFSPIAEADGSEFENLIDGWAIEYAEQFAAYSRR